MGKKGLMRQTPLQCHSDRVFYCTAGGFAWPKAKGHKKGSCPCVCNKAGKYLGISSSSSQQEPPLGLCMNSFESDFFSHPSVIRHSYVHAGEEAYTPAYEDNRREWILREALREKKHSDEKQHNVASAASAERKLLVSLACQLLDVRLLL
ncbi:unnamed protein product [Protopolystoma xenopodis]|uniref:Uncharacterized protein n=1 Tax=Protopolystoma xenopodis TaxID=117903 RepID=A0A3S5C821_9PLAT|nr:unnamed protein product [Protopolystoma xenopodis]